MESCFLILPPYLKKNEFSMWTVKAANIHNINKIHDFHSWGVAALI